MKSGIRHARAAAGVIKPALAMRHGVSPRTVHLDAPPPHVDRPAGTAVAVGEDTPWPEGPARRAAVPSAGVRGTNAHLVPEGAVGPGPGPTPEPACVAAPWVLSARSAEAPRARAARLADAVPAPVADAVATLARRSVFAHRVVVVAEGADEPRAPLDRPGPDEAPADADLFSLADRLGS